MDLFETSSFARDASSGALVNVDTKALAEHREKKKLRSTIKSLVLKNEELEKRVEYLEAKINLILNRLET